MVGAGDLSRPQFRQAAVPSYIVIKLRDQADRETPLFGKVKERQPIMQVTIQAEEIWACTTCMACVEACPCTLILSARSSN